MKIYISGEITNDPNYKEKFAKAEEYLKAKGHVIMNPAILPEGFEYEDYMTICFAMIDVCDAMYMLKDWEESPGAERELIHAEINWKKAYYEGEEFND